MNTINKSSIKISIKENNSLIKNKKLVKEEQEILEEFLGGLGDAAIGSLKRFLIKKVFDSLGITGKGIVGKILLNIANEISLDDIKSIMSGDGRACQVISTKIIQGLEETLLQKLPLMLGVKSGGMMSELMQQAIITNIIKNNNFNKTLSDSICSLGKSGVSNLINRFKLSEEKRLKNITK